MSATVWQRGMMAALGCLAGGSLYALSESFDRGGLSERPMVALAVWAVVFFGGLLGMVGPLRLARAGLAALVLATLVAGLISWAGLRFDHLADLADNPGTLLAGWVLALVPVPFLIAVMGQGKGRRGWRNYPILFAEAWSLLLRYFAGWVLVGLVWILLMLSDALLSAVGVRAIHHLLEMASAPWLITGTALGLGLAVAQEFDRVISPWLVLRLLRLLVPVLLAVLVIFLVALPVQGMVPALLGHLSITGLLIGMVAAGATLVTSAVDRSDAEATQSPLLRRATRLLAGILILPALLSVWGLGLRVSDYGWTPERLFLGLLSLLALGYGGGYLAAALVDLRKGGSGWMKGIRRTNIGMALAMLVAALLWLTPLLNAESIASRSQIARLESGRTAVAQFDLGAFNDWGRPGAAALARLDEIAKQPGQEQLAERLAGATQAPTAQPSADSLRAELVQIMPLQPEGATATRDMLLDGLDAGDLRQMTAACTARLPDGAPACVMVVADFWPDEPGEEAVFAGLTGGYSFEMMGLAAGDRRTLLRNVARIGAGSTLVSTEAGQALIAGWQAAPPALSSARLNQIAAPDGTALILQP